jgi:nucleotide-binding universal stress UspA family protein
MADPLKFLQHPLLATEHSEFDVGAERVALALAARCALPLSVVMPIAGNPEFDAVAPTLSARADDAAAARLDDLRRAAQAHGVSLVAQVRHGTEPFREIVDEARSAHADLIIIRRRGRIGLLANLLVGEMVSKVVAHAPCSVLVNARGARMWTQRIVAAIDPQAIDPALHTQAARLALAFDLPLTLVSVADSGDRRDQARLGLDAALADARSLGARVDGEVLVGRPHEQILAAVSRLGADLVVLGRQGSTRLSRAFIGGVAQKVIGLAECPAWVHAPSPFTSTRTISP